MADYRVLVVGEPGNAQARELMGSGNVVYEATSCRRLWAGLSSGSWDACIIDAAQLAGEDADLVRRARETQPLLALLVTGGDADATHNLALTSGVDDVLARSKDRALQARLTRAIRTRHARAPAPHGPRCCWWTGIGWRRPRSATR